MVLQKVSKRFRSGDSRMRRPVILSVLAVTACLVPAAILPGATAVSTGLVYVVQGLPGRTVDISVDGRTVARGVAPATIVGPFRVTSGERRITAKTGTSTVLDRRVRVLPGGSQDAVLHLPAAPTGAPVVTTYANKSTAVTADKALLRVAHTAAVGPADIRVNGQVLFANVANGESLELVVPAGTYRVEIVPAGATTPRVLGPLSLAVKGGSLNRVFAVGSPASKTMNVVVGVLTLPRTGSVKPERVDTGTGGQAALR